MYWGYSMASKENKKLPEAAKTLQGALELFKQKDKVLNERMSFLLVVKAFEILTEYGWKELKKCVESEGLEVQSPKEAVRTAAQLSLISDPELWINCINARNSSVHDYFTIPEKEYLELAEELLKSIQQIF